MGTLKGCLGIAANFNDFDELHSRATALADGGKLTNEHYARAAEDMVAELRGVQKPSTTKEPDAAPPVDDGKKEAPPQPAEDEGFGLKAKPDDLTANADKAESPKKLGAAKVAKAYATLRERLGSRLDFNDEVAIEAALESGNVAQARDLMRQIVQEVKEGRYRTTEPQAAPTNAIRHAELEKIVSAVEKVVGGNTGITILDSVTQFDPRQKPGSRAGVTTEGRVILFRDGIQSGVEGQKTVFHEMFHKGLRNLLSKEQYTATMNKLYDQSAELRKLADKYLNSDFGKQDTKGMSQEAARALAVEEVLAEKAEGTQLKPTTLRQIGNWMADVADKFGMTKLAQWLRTAGQSPLQQFINDALKASVGGDAAWGTQYRTVAQAMDDIKGKIQYDLFGAGRRFVLSSSFLNDIVERFKGEGRDKIVGLDKYKTASDAQAASAAEYQKAATKVQDAFNTLSNAERDQLNEFISRVSEMDASVEGDNKHITDAADKVKLTKLKADFALMNGKQKAAYRAARDELGAFWKKRGELLAAVANDIYQPLIDDSRAAGNEAMAKSMEHERRKFIQDTNARLASVKGDYFPLMRFGEYLVVRKSAEYEAAAKAAEAAFQHYNDILKANDQRTPEQRRAMDKANRSLEKKGLDPLEALTPEQDAAIKEAREVYQKLQDALDEMKTSEKDYYVAAFESRSEAEKHAKEAGGRVSLKQEYSRELSGISLGMLNRMQASLEHTLRGQGKADAARQARQAMYEVFLSSLPERSALTRQLKRRGVAGFDRNAHRAIVSSMLRDSFYLSRMEHGNAMDVALQQARDDAKGKSVELQEVAEELAKRHVADMQYHDTPIQNAISALTYAWQLGVSPGFLLSNLMQAPMVSAPMMWARHGAKTVSAMGRAYADTSKMVMDSVKKNHLRGEIDFEGSGISDGEKAMLNDMLKRQLLQVTLVHDLAMTADGKTQSMFKALLANPSHHVEVVNRISTALSAYRLELKSNGGNVEGATQYAAKVLNDTHFNYSIENAPRWMKPGVVPLGKLLFQFKKYQLGMISLLVRTGHAMAKGDNIQRKEAARQLIGLLTTHMAVGGLLGLPAAATFKFIAEAVAKAFGDDDEPFDAEVELRNYLTDTFGKPVADALAKGLPTMVGADMSQKVGLGDVLSPIRASNTDNKEGADLYAQYLKSMAGPFFGGILPRWFDAMAYASKGEFWKAAEGVMPKVLSDVSKAARFSEEGVTTKTGTVALAPEHVSAWDAFLQATGVPSAAISDSYEGRAAIENTKQALAKTAQQAKESWLRARKDGDPSEEWQRIVDRVNPARVRNGLKPITQGELLKFAQERAKQERSYDMYGGNVGKNKELAQEARFARDQ